MTYLLSLCPPDVNDNVPFFTSSIYESSVTEGAQIGTSVLQVSAHDKDLGLNGQVCNPARWIAPHPSAQFQFFMSHFDLESIRFATIFTHECMH